MRNEASSLSDSVKAAAAAAIPLSFDDILVFTPTYVQAREPSRI